MAKKLTKHEMIDFLIDNGEVNGWSEDSRSQLETLAEGGLRRMVATTELLVNAKADEEEEEEEEEEMPKKGKKTKMAKNAKEEADEEDEDESVEVDTKGKKKKFKGTTTNMFQKPQKEGEEETTTNEQEEITINEYLENAPPKLREMMQGGIAVFNEQKKQLVNFIFNHENNTGNFTREWLNEQEMPLLHGMARLAGHGRKPRQSYAGAAAGTPSTPILQNSRRVRPLVAPRMTFNDRRVEKN